MTDPITLGALGGVALTEGIKFLYGQAGEILKRWRDRQASKNTSIATEANQTEPIQVELPSSVFQGKLVEPKIHFNEVQETAEALSSLRKALLDYVDGIKPIDEYDKDLLQDVDSLRNLLQGIYKQRLTFKGEQQPLSGQPLLEGEAKAFLTEGKLTGLRVRDFKSGQGKGKAETTILAPGGEVVGLDVNTAG